MKDKFLKMNKWCLIIIFFLIMGCRNMNKNEVEVVSIVVSDNYQGPIIIFFQQNCEKGKVEFRNGEHFFYVPNDGVIFTKYKLGDAPWYRSSLKIYNDKLVEQVDFNNIMNPQKIPDNQYDVTGGVYVKWGFDVKYESIHFIAGTGSYIKNNYHLEDKIGSLYSIGITNCH